MKIDIPITQMPAADEVTIDKNDYLCYHVDIDPILGCVSHVFVDWFWPKNSLRLAFSSSAAAAPNLPVFHTMLLPLATYGVHVQVLHQTAPLLLRFLKAFLTSKEILIVPGLSPSAALAANIGYGDEGKQKSPPRQDPQSLALATST